ncbi:hypothetical protein HanIR_Chr16g0830121 [Helianthus annuus]|nr:hypothetical protein HanIR_Chr16g0830121 [Helianthus annuus]
MHHLCVGQNDQQMVIYSMPANHPYFNICHPNYSIKCAYAREYQYMKLYQRFS